MRENLPVFVREWVGKHLPEEHIFVPSKKRPKAPSALVRLYFRKWLVHPIKRHATHFYSRVLNNNRCQIIGVTGSAGKTTAKDMIASVLSEGFKTVASRENIDPVYNIPATVLGSPPNTEKLVLEMGIEYVGEMDYYLWLAPPQIGVITTIYLTHTQYLGSLKGVINEKGKLIRALPRNGYAVLNHDDIYVRVLAKKTKAKVLWYGISGRGLDTSAKNIKITTEYKTSFDLVTKNGTVSITIPFLGEHFVSLSLAAACVGEVCGISLDRIKKGLEKSEGLAHRMKIVKRKGILIIDDCFNANPLACREALKVLSRIGKGRRKIFVLGEMKELGKYETRAHKEVGLEARRLGVNYIFGLGGLTKHTLEAFEKRRGPVSVYLADSKRTLVRSLKSFVRWGDAILIKGSRSMAMEDVVDSLG